MPLPIETPIELPFFFSCVDFTSSDGSSTVKRKLNSRCWQRQKEVESDMVDVQLITPRCLVKLETSVNRRLRTGNHGQR